MKITRKQLRKIIIETVYVGSEGVAIDSENINNLETYNRLIDHLSVLTKDIPNTDTVMKLVKNNYPDNQMMGLELIDTLAMMSENEDEILKVTKQLRQYTNYLKTQNSPGVTNQPSAGVQYPESKSETFLLKIKPKLVSKIHDVINKRFRELVLKLRDTSKINPGDGAETWIPTRGIPLIIQSDTQLARYVSMLEEELGSATNYKNPRKKIPAYPGSTINIDADSEMYYIFRNAIYTEISPDVISKNQDVLNPNYKNSLGDQVFGFILDYMIKSDNHPDY